MKVSGYLSIYNDWDLLAPALASVLPRLDELVVVDGGYRWMAAFLEQVGRNPARSEQPVHDILAKLDIPVRIISGVWNNEIEKRLAGYRACQGRYALRLDADEVMYFNPAALDRFFASGAAVAEMEMPSYLAPGWIEGPADGGRLPRQSFLFDREQVSAEEHLHYLWLVLTADALPAVGARKAVFPEPVAFNAHLTTWRTPRTAIQRACFYVLNWNRKFGVPMIPELQDRPLEDVAALLRFIPAQDYFDSMLGSALVAGHYDLKGQRPRASPLPPALEAPLLPLYAQYHESQRQLNVLLGQRPRHFLAGQPICIDLTAEASLGAIVRDGQAVFELSEPIAAARAAMHYVLPRDPWAAELALEVAIDGKQLRIKIPPSAGFDEGALRRVLVIGVWPAVQRLTYRILAK